MSRGSSIRYSVRLPDGSSMTMGLFNLTAEQIALVQWLEAEKAWHRDLERQEREYVEKRRKTRERKEHVSRQQRLMNAHWQLVARATGFRESVLKRHAPLRVNDRDLECACCTTGDYEPDRLPFPCEEYQFARDWSGAHG